MPVLIILLAAIIALIGLEVYRLKHVKATAARFDRSKLELWPAGPDQYHVFFGDCLLMDVMDIDLDRSLKKLRRGKRVDDLRNRPPHFGERSMPDRVDEYTRTLFLDQYFRGLYDPARPFLQLSDNAAGSKIENPALIAWLLQHLALRDIRPVGESGGMTLYRRVYPNGSEFY